MQQDTFVYFINTVASENHLNNFR